VQPEVFIAVASAVVSLLSVLVTTLSARRVTLLQYRLEQARHLQTKAELAEQLLSRYREPLLWSAHALQGRLFNAVRPGFLSTFLHSGDPDDERYTRDYTVYVLADYLCWVEIIRRDLQFLDLGDVERNKRFFGFLDRMTQIVAALDVPSPLRLFRGQQRAIGELLLIRVEDSTGTRYESMGYAEFCERLDTDARFASWFNRLRTDVDVISTSDYDGNARLVRMQHEMIALIDFLDPDHARLATPNRALLNRDAIGTLTMNV
jgi:heme exporter protein D